MKIRGYSVLFVCALCVFVLCGAAAVVAQFETPEVIAEEAKNITLMATEKGLFALIMYKAFENNANFSVEVLSTAIDEMNSPKRIVDTLSLPGELPSKEDIKEEIVRLQTATTEVKNAVDVIGAANVDSLSNQSMKDKLLNKMAYVFSKMTKAEQAAAAATEENISSIDVAIERAVELQAAAEAARDLWTGAQRKLTTQIGELDAAIAAFNTVKNDMEENTKEFEKNISPETKTLIKRLTEISNFTLTPILFALNLTKNWLQNTTNTAEETQNKYRELAAKAEELKGKAEERRGSVRIRQFYDTHVYNPPNN